MSTITPPRGPLLSQYIPATPSVPELYQQYPADIAGPLLDSIRADEDKPGYAMYLDKIKYVLPGQMSVYNDFPLFPGYEGSQTHVQEPQSLVWRDRQRAMLQVVNEQVNSFFKVDAKQRIVEIRKKLGFNVELGTRFLPYFDKVERRTQKIAIYMLSIMTRIAYQLSRQEKRGIVASGNMLAAQLVYQHIHDAILINMFPQKAYDLSVINQQPRILAERTGVAEDNDDVLADIARTHQDFKMLMNLGFSQDMLNADNAPAWYSKVTTITQTPVLVTDPPNAPNQQLFIDGTDAGKLYYSADPLQMYVHENALMIDGKLCGSQIYTILTKVTQIKQALGELAAMYNYGNQTNIDQYLANILTLQGEVQDTFEKLFIRYQYLKTVINYAELLPVA